MKIEVLGTGCPKCQKVEQAIVDEIKKLGVEAEIIHITDLNAIIDRGVMITPAVVIDGEIKVEGKIPTTAEIQSWVQK